MSEKWSQKETFYIQIFRKQTWHSLFTQIFKARQQHPVCCAMEFLVGSVLAWRWWKHVKEICTGHGTLGFITWEKNSIKTQRKPMWKHCQSNRIPSSSCSSHSFFLIIKTLGEQGHSEQRAALYPRLKGRSWGPLEDHARWCQGRHSHAEVGRNQGAGRDPLTACCAASGSLPGTSSPTHPLDICLFPTLFKYLPEGFSLQFKNSKLYLALLH